MPMLRKLIAPYTLIFAAVSGIIMKAGVERVGVLKDKSSKRILIAVRIVFFGTDSERT